MYSMNTSSDKFMSMEIERGRYTDPEIFDGTQILKWIRLMEWDKIMFIKERVYAKYLREFFINLKYTRDGQQNLVLKSCVNGVQIELDVSKMNEILGTENCEATFLGSQDLCAGVGIRFEKSDIAEALWGGDTPSIMSGGDAYHRLTDLHKLLHRLIVCTVLCRGDTYRATEMSNTSMCCLYAAVKGEKLNIGFIILENIVSTLTEGKKRIPYGMVFSMIFKKFGVPLEDQECESDELFGKGFLSIQTLKRMGFEKRPDRTWGFKPKKIAKGKTEGSSSDMVKIVTDYITKKPEVIYLDTDSEKDCTSPKKENVSLEEDTSPKNENVSLEEDSSSPKNYHSTPQNVISSPKEAKRKDGYEEHGASASFNMPYESGENLITSLTDLLELGAAIQSTTEHISDMFKSWNEKFIRDLDETDGLTLNSKEKIMDEYHDGASASSNTPSTSLETIMASLNDLLEAGASFQYAHEVRTKSHEARMNTHEERMDTFFYAIDKHEKKMDRLNQLIKRRKRLRVAGLDR